MTDDSLPLPQVHWVFGYGSLMWNPGFSFEERAGASLVGLHRALCIRSQHHRGTPERPGLVFGLDNGGSCTGVAYRVAPQLWEETVAYLRRREQVTSVYLEAVHSLTLDDGRHVSALLYRANRHHPQYCGSLSDAELLEAVAGASGISGRNADYVLATHDHLDELGIVDHTLEKIARQLRARSQAFSRS